MAYVAARRLRGAVPVGSLALLLAACGGGSSSPPCTPTGPEVCDGLDNDCDGLVDDGDPGGGAACATGLPGVCAAGARHCQGGGLPCVQDVQPSAEVCDGLDNDCDGVVDDGDPGGGAACNTGLLGVCAAGTYHCSGGAPQCAQDVQPSAEVCDGFDNDCDGTVDEGCSCTNAIVDPGFEAGPPWPAWAQFSTNFGTPLCSLADCGSGGSSQPAHGGTYWVWFGGVPLTEVGYVRQSVLIPVGSNALRFWFQAPVCAPVAADFLDVRIDGAVVYHVTATDTRCGVGTYSEVVLDISAYANGQSHLVEFHSETHDSGQVTTTNFFVDDVSIPVCL
ncbi:MAG TPA: putative metal-binding motif-containing protein [Acidimicrobiales bacterium]|nr:putative metal-binding motif-containing protein [Acidimicrobiales bacterium]